MKRNDNQRKISFDLILAFLVFLACILYSFITHYEAIAAFVGLG